MKGLFNSCLGSWHWFWFGNWFGLGLRFGLEFGHWFWLGFWLGRGLGRWLWRGRAQQLGQLTLCQPALLPAQAWLGGVQHHLPHQAVEGRIQRFAESIHQFQQQAVAAGLPALEPKGGVLIHQKAVAIDGYPQAPAAVVIPQALEGCIQQQPVE